MAHSDGKRLYIGDQAITREELARLAPRDVPAERTIIMAVCSTGRTAVRLNQVEGFAQIFVEKGFATSIVAPGTTIGRAEVETLFDSIGTKLDSLLEKLQAVTGRWQLLVELESLAARVPNSRIS